MSTESKPAKLDSDVSAHDKDVLNRIFNPEMPYDDYSDEEADQQIDANDGSEETEDVKQAKELELSAVKTAEAGDLSAALDILNKAVNLVPDWPSAYNNRAQVLRLMGDVEGALEDLNKAIDLSRGHSQAACQAYTQRGIIHRLEGHDDLALVDLKKAAGLGSKFAKQLVVALNPYAALCNQILGQVMHNIRSGEQ